MTRPEYHEHLFVLRLDICDGNKALVISTDRISELVLAHVNCQQIESLAYSARKLKEQPENACYHEDDEGGCNDPTE